AIFLANASAIAHHSFAAEYDANKPVTFVGTVTKMEWINPHAWIHLDVKKPDGTVENWAVEAGPPGTLVRAGFNRNSLPPGTGITISLACSGASRSRHLSRTTRIMPSCSSPTTEAAPRRSGGLTPTIPDSLPGSTTPSKLPAESLPAQRARKRRRHTS